MFDRDDCTKDVVPSPEASMAISKLQCQECFIVFPEDQVHVRYESDPGPRIAGGRGRTRVSIQSCPRCRSEWITDYSPALCVQCGDEEVDNPDDICGWCIGENAEHATDKQREES